MPGPRESLAEVGATRRHLVVTLYENVKGRARIFTPAADGGWAERKLDLPDNASIALVDADLRSDEAFLNVTGFLMPTSLWLVDAADRSVAKVKTLPPQFDASTIRGRAVRGDVEGRHEDPVLRGASAAMKLDGRNPTMLNAYGGFQVSRRPSYSPNIGKLWLERGGVFVLANIRGGGEFGPAWHEAGLKTQRQRDLRRLRRRGAGSDRAQASPVRAAAGHPGRLERRPADGRGVHPASGAVECRRYSGAAARHAAVREDRRGRIVGRRVRQRRESSKSARSSPSISPYENFKAGRRAIPSRSSGRPPRMTAWGRSTRASSPPSWRP